MHGMLLPNEFMAPTNQVVQEEASPDINEDEQLGLMAQLVLAKQATFDKPAKNRHMRPLYLRGYVWHQSDYMHRSLINNFNHMFLNKTCQDCLYLQNMLVR
jgi:hypothetical protein